MTLTKAEALDFTLTGWHVRKKFLRVASFPSIRIAAPIIGCIAYAAVGIAACMHSLAAAAVLMGLTQLALCGYAIAICAFKARTG